jgi:hypothetical protein
MQSKWLDAGSSMAAFHLQSKAYEKVQPPSFGSHQEINDVVLERQRSTDTATPERRMERINESINNSTTAPSKQSSKFGQFLMSKKKKIKKNLVVELPDVRLINAKKNSIGQIPRPKTRAFRRCSFTMNSADDMSSSGITISGRPKETLPSLFLQEGAHLVSLLSAVALSTLRNDIDGTESPLTEFVPGKVWPAFNSDNDPDMQRYGYHQSGFITRLRYVFDISRTKKERAIYNNARPFPVIGGISDREAQMLQSARGPTAKVALVNFWFNEFVIREHLHGSMGKVSGPIISRIQQYQSDGFLWYNSARKLSYIPFPFPHAQITTIFVLVSIFTLPVLMISFLGFWAGMIFNFFTALIFAGLNEVAKELEYPFRCMPNDLPLNLFQAQFNEALLTMFAGYHPDSWWEVNTDVLGDVSI